MLLFLYSVGVQGEDVCEQQSTYACTHSYVGRGRCLCESYRASSRPGGGAGLVIMEWKRNSTLGKEDITTTIVGRWIWSVCYLATTAIQAYLETCPRPQLEFHTHVHHTHAHTLWRVFNCQCRIHLTVLFAVGTLVWRDQWICLDV